jgi:hypothetical protein
MLLIAFVLAPLFNAARSQEASASVENRADPEAALINESHVLPTSKASFGVGWCHKR